MVSRKEVGVNMAETSETELISGTESFSSDNNKYIINPSLSLDNLFSELSQETKDLRVPEIKDDDDEFKRIQKSISGLPKLESCLEKNLDNEESKSKKINDITRINDPIIIKPKKSNNEASDAGSKWFGMKQPELTPAVKRDLSIIKQRSALDPKRHYKKDKWEIPKYFQMGTIIEGNTEFYSARMARRERGTNMVNEVLHDTDKGKYFRKKYNEIQSQRTSGGKSHYKKVKSMRKKY